MNFKKLEPLIANENFSVEIINYINSSLIKLGASKLFIQDFIEFDRIGVGRTKNIGGNIIFSLRINDLFFFSKKNIFLRSGFYYNAGNSISLLFKNFTRLRKTLNRISNSMTNNKFIFVAIKFCLLDNLRNIVLHIKNLIEDYDTTDLSVNFLKLYKITIFEYFKFLIDGEVNFSAILNQYNKLDIPALRYKLNSKWKDRKFSNRELDNPLEIIALSLQIMLSKKTYDIIVDFPSGSLSIGDSINAISSIISGVNLSTNVISLNTSLYRLRDSRDEKNLTSFLSDSLKRMKKVKFLLVDDNLFSGATLIYFRQMIQKIAKPKLIDIAVGNIYLKGLNSWKNCQYQFILNTDLLTIFTSINNLDKLYPKIFRKQNQLLLRNQIYAIDIYGKKIVNSDYLWKAEINERDFAVFNNILTNEKIFKLKQLYGFHPYSLIYEGYFDLLTFRPISEVSFDNLYKYTFGLN